MYWGCSRLGLGAALAFATMSPAFAASETELETRLQELAEQVAALKQELATLKSEKVIVTEPLVSLTPDVPAATPSGATGQLSFSGYGELDYARPTDDTSDTTADAHRFVLGVNYQFDDRTRLVTEIEFEHAITSSEDPGETALEQFYIERTLSDRLLAKSGLFLIPSGILNEVHEPPRYYGVFRNRVEKAIIPTTWREGGLLVEGTTSYGLRWDVGVTTGFNLANWDPTSSDGRASPLGSIHQELAEAKASDLAGVVAVNYTGIPGLRLGASVFSGDGAQGQPGFDDNQITLWEAHAQWSPGRWDFAALYARGTIENTAEVNAQFIGQPTLIPKSFFGWYTQAAYRLWQRDSASLYPFVRFERLNTAAGFATIGAGFNPVSPDDLDVVTTGFNFDFANGVVVKADYQFVDGDNGTDQPGNQFDLGLGYEF